MKTEHAALSGRASRTVFIYSNSITETPEEFKICSKVKINIPGSHRFSFSIIVFEQVSVGCDKDFFFAIWFITEFPKRASKLVEKN